MPIFGYNTVGASNTNSLTRGFGHGNAAHHHTAGANETITSLHFYTRNTNDTAEIGVYDMGVGGTPAGATLIGTATITAPSDIAQWVEVAVDIPLTEGNSYFLAYASANGIRRYFDVGAAGDSTEDLNATAGALQATWSENATDDEIVSLYATYEQGGGLDLAADATGIASISGDLSPGIQPAELTAAATGVSSVSGDLSPGIQPAELTAAATGVSSVSGDLSPGASFTISGSPAEIRPTEQFSFAISNPATVPTVGNTTGNFAGLPGLAPDSVSGVDPYNITWTLPKSTARKFDPTGYAFDITVGAESTNSAAIPYSPAPGQQYIDVDTPDPSTQVALQYSFGTPETGDQWVWTTPASGIGIAYDSQLFAELSEQLAQTIHSAGYLIKASGAVQQEGVIQFGFDVGLFAAAAGAASASADLTTPPKTFNADATGIAAINGDLSLQPKTLNANATAAAAISSPLTIPPKTFNASITATATTAANVTFGPKALNASATATANVSAPLTVVLELNASATGEANISASLNAEVKELNAAATSSATTAASLTLQPKTLSANATGSASITGDLKVSAVQLAANATGLATISAALDRDFIPAEYTMIVAGQTRVMKIAQQNRIMKVSEVA